MASAAFQEVVFGCYHLLAKRGLQFLAIAFDFSSVVELHYKQLDREETER